MNSEFPCGGSRIVSGQRDAVLHGRCVVVTRGETADGPLGTRLAARGAFPRYWPVVQTQPPADPGPLDAALAGLAEYDWIVFSSPRAVAVVVERAGKLPEGVRVAAVGESTAASLMAEGWPVDLVPKVFGGEGLVGAFSEIDLAHGAAVLLPASAIARATIPDGLRRLGARVDCVVAYETVAASLDSKVCIADIESGCLDAVTFASPSAVSGLYEVLGRDLFGAILGRLPAVAIGDTTAEALEHLGTTPAAVARPSTLDGLVDAVVTVLTTESN